MSWIPVCKTTEVTEDFPKAVKVKEKELGVFIVDDEYFCIENICPHAYAHLSDGFVDGQTIECPLHEAIFDIPSGKLERGPGGCRDLKTYPVKVEGDDIHIQVTGE